ncbi:MAG: hypothetical protein ABSA17_06010 [Rhabdochlamydiaceae bacterium]
MISGIRSSFSALCGKFRASSEQKKAAIKIQRAWRRARSREKSKAEVAPHLALHLLPGATTLRREVNRFLTSPLKETIPSAGSGKTPVYFPNEFPQIILKASSEKCCQRFQQMIFARNLCTDMMATSLVVPRALLNKVNMKDGKALGNFLIEERLPLKEISDFEQQKLYMENLDKATPAIQQFTHFIFRSGARDLCVQDQFFPRKCINYPRYDNYPLFLTEKGELKIGLIDLETIDVKRKLNIATLYQLVYMFPYHKAVILEAARSYFTNIPSCMIDAWERSGKELIQIGCIDLQTYLTNKVNPKIELTPQVKSAIIDEVTKEAQLTEEECTIIGQSLNLIIETVNIIKEVLLEHRPLYYFNSKFIRFPIIQLPGYSTLQASLSDGRRKILNNHTLIDYLLKKLVDHKVVYDVFLNGVYGTLVD